MSAFLITDFTAAQTPPLTLGQAVDAAVRTYPAVRSSLEQVSAAAAGINLARTAYLPRADFLGQANRATHNNVFGMVLPQGVIPSISGPALAMNSANNVWGTAIGGLVYRNTKIPQLTNLVIFGDNPSGEIFYVNADNLPKGGQDPIHQILLNDNGASKTYIQVIKEKNAAQGKPAATRADLRFAEGPDGQIFLLNMRDGTIRLLVPGK